VTQGPEDTSKIVAPATRTPGRGRPRNLEVDAAVLRAGWQVLATAGYTGLTFEAVAEHAGCSRPALYRRFANKRDLVLELIHTAAREFRPDVDEEEDPRHALIEHLKAYVRYLKNSGGAVMLALSQARRADPQLSQALDELLLSERQQFVRALDAAGPVPPDAVDVLIDVLLGAVSFRVALCDGEMADAEIEQIVDMTLNRARTLSPTGGPAGRRLQSA
jgi:AcrR family transcriptional regulator